MKKLDYLKYIIQNKVYTKRAWIIKAFSITKEDNGFAYVGQIVNNTWGYSFYNDAGELIRISDSKPSEPLFRFNDKITIDQSWLINVKEPTITTVGNLLVNALCIVHAFGNKYPFITGSISVDDIESTIAPLLKDTPENDQERDGKYFYTDEYIKFTDSLQYLSSLSQLCIWAASEKNITPPTGISEFKQKLTDKYEGKLDDPIELSKFEGELRAYDAEYLKGDPTDGKFTSGKIKNVARKKMFLTVGSELGFEETTDVDPIINSLDEGWSLDPNDHVNAMNGLRAASYSRGSETVKGGVTAKTLLRSASNFVIEDTDCQTKLGIKRSFNGNIIEKLVGRYILINGIPILVSSLEEAKKYIDRPLIVRSPMYCILPGDTLCAVCAGKKLSQFSTGVGIPLTEISSIILTSSLKKMHQSVLSTAKIDIHSIFS